MGLTGRALTRPAMASQDEPQLKYTYRFRVEAKPPSAFDEDTSKAEVQVYINELLGLKESAHEKERIITG